MRVVVLTSCTGAKAVGHARALGPDDFRRGAAHVARRERECAEALTPAEDLYAGAQHLRLLRGLRAYRQRGPAGGAVDLRILSAGYGLVPHDRRLAPYDCTFQGLRAGEVRARADALGVPAAVRRLLAAPYDLGLVLLGEDYLRACALDAAVRLGGPTLFFCGARAAARLPRLDRGRAIVLSRSEARRFACGLVGLKGEVAARLLARLADEPALAGRLLDPAEDVLALLDQAPAPAPTRRVSPRPPIRPRADVDRVIALPPDWAARPHRARFRYFIPDWDDHVDPDYDFLAEAHSGGRGDWSNEVYAHQLYPAPPYDGILVSRAVIERGKKAEAGRRARFERLGVHRYLRVPDAFPVLGDCGAFAYIDREEPPYATAEVLDYYTRLGFDYGVSVDHLIVAAAAARRQFRYDLTLHNAEEFLREHRRRELPWAPIGAAQGWDPPSYAEAARRLVAMGYRYIGLGGLVRSTTADILRIVEEVRAAVPAATRIHLFGVARLSLLGDLARLGVASADSATYLRRAWLDPAQNLLMPDGWYSALRIPYADRHPRARRLVESGERTVEDLRRLEAACLAGLRAYAAGRAGPTDALIEDLVEYDALFTRERGDARARIRRTLEARPWARCGCALCARWGVEVAIFRGNDRNRRRGFHNTHVFYHLMQRVLAGEPLPWPRPAATDDRGARQLALFAAAG